MKVKELLTAGTRGENPIAHQIIGICSVLAVTTSVENALIMCVALTVVTASSNTLISLLRNQIPARTRIIAEMLIIATLVIVVDQTLKAFFWDSAKVMGAYIALIITNCIVMGRAEAFALKNPPWASFWDGIANGLGYSGFLIVIGLVRELFGTGGIRFVTLASFHLQLVPESIREPNLAGGYSDILLMVLPPGAFFMLGIFIWVFKVFWPQPEEAK